MTRRAFCSRLPLGPSRDRGRGDHGCVSGSRFWISGRLAFTLVTPRLFLRGGLLAQSRQPADVWPSRLGPSSCRAALSCAALWGLAERRRGRRCVCGKPGGWSPSAGCEDPRHAEQPRRVGVGRVLPGRSRGVSQGRISLQPVEHRSHRLPPAEHSRGTVAS